MQPLKQKIKNTFLLSDQDKIDILVALDTYPESDVQALEVIIDDFDKQYKQSIDDYKQAIYNTLDTTVSKTYPAAAAQIKSGIDTLVVS